MEQIMVKAVKTEVLSNGGILLYYVDDNGESQEGILNSIEDVENDEEVSIQDNSYILGSFDDLAEDESMEESAPKLEVTWTDEDTKRLLLFFNDNKGSFISGVTQKKHLWAVACKTMLVGKEQDSCEAQLNELKQKYCEVRNFIKKGIYVKWPFLDLCHQAFHDDPEVVEALNDKPATLEPLPEVPEFKPKIAVLKQETIKDDDGIIAIKQVNTKPPDLNVEKMLNLYLKYKASFQKEHWRRDLWDQIAKEMGENDSDYLQKRFLNHKQHYINILIKKKETNANIKWPYMELFDKIYADDASFQKKHFNVTYIEPVTNHTIPEHEWSDVQRLVLAKYYYDCYEEFEDSTIPNRFLWTEVGRLVEKKPDSCETKYEMLRREHLDNFISENYNLNLRKPISIIFDSIIVKDVKEKLNKSDIEYTDIWDVADVDELVQFLYDKIELFKDTECHFVCFAAIAHKLKKSIINCKNQWDELVLLYKTILEDKKENSDMHIDWRYIELFDRIFDYGMDANLLKGYCTAKPPLPSTDEKVRVKKIVIDKEFKEDRRDQAASKDDPDYVGPRTDPRTTKILEHYLKNKEKFQVARDKLAAWEPLSKQIGITTTQCAHRFKSLKQTYIDYVKKEIDRPKVAITWPYYALCKKVFGYRIIKTKLKEGLLDTDNNDWLAREIKLLITFFSKNFHEITNNVDDVSKWAPLASKLGKSEICCKEKFVELRKCYRKLKTMRRRNPDVKISWSYFDMFDRIYNVRDEAMEVEALDEENLQEGVDGVEGMEQGGEDDYQCIIVLQEGEELRADLANAQIIVQEPGQNIEQILNMSSIEPSVENTSQNISKWTKRNKKRLLINYINYVRLHRGQEINPQEMWKEIANKFPDKKPGNCRRMLLKMKNNFKQSDELNKNSNPLASLLYKVVKLKPKLVKNTQERIFKDVQIDSAVVHSALTYYLENIEEFVNPMFEKKYLWNQLAQHVCEPVTKIYNKINYLKQAYNIETEEIGGEVTEYSGLLKEIISKEVAVNIVLDVNPTPEFHDEATNWLDDEIEQLMLWYLSNLEKFKNPKFNKSYLWKEASAILQKSPLVCSKKMSEVRTLYRNMVKENAEGLNEWRFFELCQKIYGTGKKINAISE